MHHVGLTGLVLCTHFSICDLEVLKDLKKRVKKIFFACLVCITVAYNDGELENREMIHDIHKEIKSHMCIFMKNGSTEINFLFIVVNCQLIILEAFTNTGIDISEGIKNSTEHQTEMNSSISEDHCKRPWSNNV